MNARLVYSAERVDNEVLRTLINGQRGLIVRCPWRQDPLTTYRTVAPQLTGPERAALAASLGVNPLRDYLDGPA